MKFEQLTLADLHYDGDTYDPGVDKERLDNAMGRTYRFMRSGQWTTLRAIADNAGCSESGASARLRDFRKEKFARYFGVARVENRRRDGGVWEYRMICHD